MLRIIAGTALAAFAAFAGPAAAQDWPNRPVTLVVPYAAGGPVDTIARIMAARLSEILGQQMVIENVGGAGGLTGTVRVAKAAPDGYTLLLSGSAVLSQNPTFRKQSPYDPVTDFAHVALFSDSARVLIARKDFPPDDFKTFLTYANVVLRRELFSFGPIHPSMGINWILYPICIFLAHRVVFRLTARHAAVYTVEQRRENRG